jgi:hypothetical protein
MDSHEYTNTNATATLTLVEALARVPVTRSAEGKGQAARMGYCAHPYLWSTG